MSRPQEHDYIGLSETPSMERISDKLSSSSSSSTLTTEEKNGCKNNTKSLNLKETELSLGLPGLSLFGKDIDTKGYSVSPLKNLVSGAKRGFSDAIDGNRSEVNSTKVAVFFSSRGENVGSQKLFIPARSKKEVVGGAAGAQSPKPIQEKNNQVSGGNEKDSAPAAKAQVVGWPPIRSFRKNTMASRLGKNNEDAEGKSGFGCLYVKVSMDGAPYLRKVDLKTCNNYAELSSALEKMFSCFTIGQCSSHGLPGGDGLNESHLKDLLHSSEYVLTYEDKDGDWMLVGDVPWEMFINSCKRLRIMKGSEAIGLGRCFNILEGVIF
uniref:Auxin-responsive protein n=1 Tax=Rhizophora mucronata TaxID=61149 RepID=A0A2P2KL19_RHIMU